MRQIIFYTLKYLGFAFRIIGIKPLYMSLITKAYTFKGVKFLGRPKYIDFNVFLDPSGDLVIGAKVVISVGVTILTHDYSLTTGLIAIGKAPHTDIALLSKVEIGENVFIGAQTTILPGTRIGHNVIISAGSVVKGLVKSNSIIAGNPAGKILCTDSWAQFHNDNLYSYNILVDKK
jgi:acetyltransferase-like isoleucine patch superfamily enzyme